jgi:tetratricopeptide (TPR) repeat protein
MSRRPDGRFRVPLTVALSSATGGVTLVAVGARGWLPWLATLAVAVGFGKVAQSTRPKNDPAQMEAPPTRAQAVPPPDRHGFAVYPLHRPIRPVPVQGLDDVDVGTVSMHLHSQVLLCRSPSSVVGPLPDHVALTGHNLVVGLVAGDAPLTVREVRARINGEQNLDVDSVLQAEHRMPDLAVSPDLVASIEQSVRDYRRLRRPELAVLLDDGPAVRPLELAEGTRSLPVVVEAGASVELVLAVVTDRPWRVNWQLAVDLECGGVSATATCDLAVTASTMAATFHPGGAEPTPVAVQDSHPDHWSPDRSWSDDEVPDKRFRLAAHTSADGTAFSRVPSEPVLAPESDEAARLRARAEEDREAGRTAEALAGYRAAANAGSARAAYELALTLQRGGHAETAAEWYRRAANLGHPLALNNLGTIALMSGKVEEAEQWFRRAVDLGDWTAALNLGATLHEQGRLEQAEHWWRLASVSDSDAAANAAYNLGLLLQRQGRHDEAETTWERAVEAGNADAALHLGHLRYTEGRGEEAEKLWRAGYDRGHALCGLHLGHLLALSDRSEEAALVWARVAAPEQPVESGSGSWSVSLGAVDGETSAEAAVKLGFLLAQQNDARSIGWFASVIAAPGARVEAVEVVAAFMSDNLAHRVGAGVFDEGTAMIGTLAAQGYRRLVRDAPGEHREAFLAVLADLGRLYSATGQAHEVVDVRSEIEMMRDGESRRP